MNQYLKKLSRLEFVVTSACTGRCKHCSQGEHNSSVNIDKDLAADAVRKIAENYAITSVMTFGGEPLLYPKTVYEIHKAAKEMNVPQRQLITNGYFSRDSAVIKSVAEGLRDCGVNDLLISVDAFHQETIPINTVKSFAEAVLEAGIPVRVQPAWLVSDITDNPYNNRTREILSEFGRMGIDANEGNIIFPAGNALKYLGEYFDTKKQYKNPYDENPTDIRAICFSADGNILGCSLYNKDIIKILEDYRPL